MCLLTMENSLWRKACRYAVWKTKSWQAINYENVMRSLKPCQDVPLPPPPHPATATFTITISQPLNEIGWREDGHKNEWEYLKRISSLFSPENLLVRNFSCVTYFSLFPLFPFTYTYIPWAKKETTFRLK